MVLKIGNLSQAFQGTHCFGIPSSLDHAIKRRSNPNAVFICSMGEQDKITETFFISHGTRMTAVDKSLPARLFFQGWKDKVYSKKPESILVISAHWETVATAVSAADHPDLIYGPTGFPFPSFYQLKYPAPGAPDVASRVQELLTESGIQCVIDKKHGLDHAAWIPLMLMYPETDIPVCQLSVQPHLDGTHHYNLGKALAPLKEEGVLIIGSGSAVHPSNDTPISLAGVAPWAAEFDNWLEEVLTSGRYEDACNYETKAPNWKIAHPSPEHLYPLHVAMGAAGERFKAELIHRSWMNGTLGYASYKFTSC